MNVGSEPQGGHLAMNASRSCRPRSGRRRASNRSWVHTAPPTDKEATASKIVSNFFISLDDVVESPDQ
jgi:hypothetical protein